MLCCIVKIVIILHSLSMFEIDALTLSIITFNNFDMNKLLESRFMQTAMSGITCQGSEKEFAVKLGEFQQYIRDLLFNGWYFVDIDFILQDPLSVFGGINIRKKWVFV